MIWSKTVLVWSRLEIFVDSGQNQRILSRLGREARYEVLTEVSLPGFGIGMIMKTSISPKSDNRD